MRFSIAALATLAMGVAATDYTTEVVTHFTTYCPEATSIVHGSHTYSVSTPGAITMSHGPYTVTRPLITKTITECNKCTSTAPAVPPTSTPLVPSGAGATTPGSGPAPTQTPYNAASRAATGAGAGLAAVFGAAALLL
ncbi:hypothetical protein N7510_008718 [Penicillium lagena]|uniref:uncharacterized protein n=1 Tax=Penicillium lagena TaxID=94218 RepID=UPI002541919A|nr:uncharacterized protein N7510_008718 [Penicillium lagena]KAJ5605937.1 hypothetical protein N7510_008718 [Penicillium lagena]